jgi:hypothetical protein
MAKPKRVDPIKQREKRAKIAAIAGAVLFLGVGAYEVPSVMKMMNQKPPPGANATDAGNRNPDGSIPLPSVAVSSGLTGNGQLADTDAPPASADGQLVSFSMFETKNPFVPQVTTSSADTVASAPTTANKAGADVPPATTTPTATTPSTTTPTATTSVVPQTAPAAPGTTTATPTVAPPPAVSISVNGAVSHVAAQGTFPSGSPVFRLVSYTSTTANIAIVGGSYAAGNATLTLHVDRPVTLENQTDGKRYTLVLVGTR